MIFISIYSKDYYKLLNLLHVLKIRFKEQSRINVFCDLQEFANDSYSRASKIFSDINWCSAGNYYVKQFEMFLESGCEHFMELSSYVFDVPDIRESLVDISNSAYFYTYERPKLSDRYQKCLKGKISKYGSQLVDRHDPWPIYNAGMVRLLLNYYRKYLPDISHQILSPLLIQMGYKIDIYPIQTNPVKSLEGLSYIQNDLNIIEGRIRQFQSDEA